MGSGIPEELRNKVFEPFFTTKPGASGLGLTASYTIVMQHSGRMDHRPRTNGGTVFTVELPAARVGTPSSQPARLKETGGRAKILVVEDDPAVKQIYHRVLPEIGYVPEVVTDGPSAIAQYRAAAKRGQPFDLVIVDLSLPGGLSGKEVFVELRSIEPDVIGVVASGYPNDPAFTDHRAIGFAAALSKPFTLNELETALKAATNHHHE